MFSRLALQLLNDMACCSFHLSYYYVKGSFFNSSFCASNSAREKMRWNFDDKVFEASNRVLNIILDAMNKIRSLKPPVDTNERYVYAYLVSYSSTCFAKWSNSLLICFFFFVDGLLLHFSEAKRLMPLSNAINL
jgi:hypothetical protein